MAIEQMLTILLGTAVGVAVVLYTVKPRHIGASQSFLSGGSSVETFTLPSQSSSFSQNDPAPSPEVTATKSSVVEAPVAEVHAISTGSVSTVTVAAAGRSSDAAIASTDASGLPVAVESHASSAARSHRAPRKSPAASRTHAKPRATGGRAISKPLD